MLFGRFGHIFGIAVPHQIQLGEDRQVMIQQFADDSRVGERRRADQGGIRAGRFHGLPDGSPGVFYQTQFCGFGPAGVGAVHAHDRQAGVHAFGQPGATFAHAAQTYDEKFHNSMLLCGSNAGTGPS